MRRFDSEQIYVPKMIASAKAMQGALQPLRPLLARSGVEPVAKVALGTVLGDLHDIGKNLVGLMLGGGGFEVIDLGSNVDPARLVQAVQEGAFHRQPAHLGGWLAAGRTALHLRPANLGDDLSADALDRLDLVRAGHVDNGGTEAVHGQIPTGLDQFGCRPLRLSNPVSIRRSPATGPSRSNPSAVL